MKDRSALLLEIILVMLLYGNSIYTAECRGPAAHAIHVFCVTKFFAIS